MRPVPLFATRALGAGALAGLFCAPLPAVTCNVPTTPYPTLGAAVRDAGCTLVQLAAGSFAEHVDLTRDLAIEGAGSASTTLQGHLRVTGAGNDVTLNGLTIDGTATGVAGCWGEILLATGGGTVTAGADLRALNTAVLSSGCRLFADGFESGGTLAWSVRLP